jgi:hypothetical protein
LPTAESVKTNLPGPVQEAQEAVAALVEPVQPSVDSLTQRVPVTSTGESVSLMASVDPIPEQDEENADESKPTQMLRTETNDSVQIIGDIVA